MTIRELLRRGWSRVAIAGTLGVSEGAVRYHERRHREGQPDGRHGRQRQRAEAVAAEIEAWLSAESGRRERLNVAALHEYLVREHGCRLPRSSVTAFSDLVVAVEGGKERCPGFDRWRWNPGRAVGVGSVVGGES